MTARRRCRNAAAQELLREALIGSAWGVALACLIGAGLAIGVHWNDIVFELELRAIAADLAQGRE